MILPGSRRAAPSTRPALELIALARLSPEIARKNLRALLLANPDHFGSLNASSFKAILKIENDTTYEGLAGLGYSARSERLRAIIRIHQQTGYSAGNSAQGSMEYVRFYLSHDGGGSWLDQGMRALNVVDREDPIPHDQGVTLRIRPREKLLSAGAVQRVRAILSWNLMPPTRTPNWTPVWGDVAEAEVRIEEFRFIPPEKLFNSSEVESTHDDAATLKLNHRMEPLCHELPLPEAVGN